MSKVCHLSFIRGVPSDEDQAEDLLMQCHRLGKSSRREFLRGAAAIALTGRGFMSLEAGSGLRGYLQLSARSGGRYRSWAGNLPIRDECCDGGSATTRRLS